MKGYQERSESPPRLDPVAVENLFGGRLSQEPGDQLSTAFTRPSATGPPDHPQWTPVYSQPFRHLAVDKQWRRAPPRESTFNVKSSPGPRVPGEPGSSSCAPRGPADLVKFPPIGGRFHLATSRPTTTEAVSSPPDSLGPPMAWRKSRHCD